MAEKKIYVGDIGTVIYVAAGEDSDGNLIDISSATERKIKVIKHDGTLVTWDCLAHDNNTIKYTSVAGDFDQGGNYVCNGYVKMPAGEWHGKTFTLKVYELGK